MMTSIQKIDGAVKATKKKDWIKGEGSITMKERKRKSKKQIRVKRAFIHISFNF